MRFNRAFWGFILGLAVVDFTFGSLIALYPRQQASLVFAFATVQLLAFGLVAVAFLILLRKKKNRVTGIRLVTAEQHTKRWPAVALTSLGILALIHTLYTVNHIAGSQARWRWYEVVSLCSGLLLSTIWVLLAYTFLKKGPTKH
jgi:uncharacterized membrane protein HdeD (DUF308 family)